MRFVRYIVLVAVVATLIYVILHPFAGHRPSSKGSIQLVVVDKDKFVAFQAKQAVQLAHDDYAVELDYSDRSIADVEHILDSLQHKWFFKHDEMWARWFGYYIGEVLRRNHRVGWIAQKDSSGKRRDEILLSRTESTDPIGQCRKRLQSGDAYNVSTYYASLVNSLDGRK